MNFASVIHFRRRIVNKNSYCVQFFFY